MAIEKNNCNEMPCPERDDYQSATPGVLLSHEIKHYAKNHRMIEPFDPDLLKPAGYKLTLGKDYAIGGELKELSNEPGKNTLEIPPFEVAIISTGEVINLPRFIIARWNLRVDLVYEGLLWTGALQVDPGWCGRLYCPIYNLSNEKVTLKLGQPVCLMDFVKTTPYEKGNSKDYDRPPKLQNLREYNYKLKSALSTEAAQKIDKVESKVSKIESLIGLFFTSIAILFTALAILVTSRNVSIDQFSPPSWFILWTFLSILLSGVAIYISLSKVLRQRLWFTIMTSVILLVIFIGGGFFINSYTKDVRRIWKELNSLRSEIELKEKKAPQEIPSNEVKPKFHSKEKTE